MTEETSAMMLVDTSLARRLELSDALSNVGCVETQQGSGTAAVLRIAGGYATYAGPMSPNNRAVGLGLSGPVSAEELDQVEAFFGAHEAPPGVDVCPLADPSLVELLGQRGYRLRDFYDVCIRPLRREDASFTPPAGMRVRAITPDEATLWAETVSRGFMGQEELTPEDVEIGLSIYRNPATTCFLAWLDGEPAGAGALECHEGVAYLMGTSCRMAWRGRGVQAALLHARVAEAVARGCELAMTQATPGTGSRRNVERAGFRLAYTKPTLSRP